MPGHRIGVLGLPNTGKSYSRRSIKDGENCFIISPSSKATHLKDSKGVAVRPLNLKIKSVEGFEQIQKKLNVNNRHEVIRTLNMSTLPEGTEISGNYALVPKMKYVQDYMQFIDKNMPNIHTIFITDFTHFISNILSTESFRNRKKGSEAFARFWDLAADSLNNILLSSDRLERELLVVIEFHAKYDEELDKYKIFVPAGNMLSDKFLPESYFDYMVHAHVIDYDDEPDDSKRFKFVITKKDRYDGRMSNLFEDIQVDGMIPNDMSLVLDRVREDLGIN